MKAAIYTRVSTDNQAEVEFNSCETQELKIRSFISSQNDIEVYKVYSDAGYSGANIDRPALQEMLQDIQNGRINAVISYKIDRLTRSPKDFYSLIEIFERNGASYISVTERFDTSTPSGRLLRNIMLTFAQFERELISERVRDKMIERAKKGLWNSGQTPFGYKRENKRLIIEPREADIVRNIFEIYVSTGSISEAYKQLKNKRLFYRNGLPISNTRIDFVLKNIVYTGKIDYKSNIYQGIHEPIISEILFEEAQKLHGHRPRKPKISNYALFPRLITCKSCGSVMSSVFTNKFKNGRRVRYFYYRCCGITKRDRSFCDLRQVSVDRLDKFIVDFLCQISENKQYVDSLIFTLNHGLNGNQTGIEPNNFGLYFSAERLKRILMEIIQASRLPSKSERRITMKRHIGNIIYSKETIEVKILYCDISESKDLPAASDAAKAAPAAEHNACADNDAAACRSACAAPSRLLVRNEQNLRQAGIEPATR